MADLQPFFAPSVTATIAALPTLGNGVSATTTNIQNTEFFDFLTTVTITTAAGATVGGFVEVYVQGSLNNSVFDDSSNDKWVGTIALAAAGAQTRIKVMSLAAAFGGTMPPFFRIRVKNSTGDALTAGSIVYRGATAQTV